MKGRERPLFNLSKQSLVANILLRPAAANPVQLNLREFDDFSALFYNFNDLLLNLQHSDPVPVALHRASK
jgi:hypothetical protein